MEVRFIKILGPDKANSLFLVLVTEKLFICLFISNRVKPVVINSLQVIYSGKIIMQIICRD